MLIRGRDVILKEKQGSRKCAEISMVRSVTADPLKKKPNLTSHFSGLLRLI